MTLTANEREATNGNAMMSNIRPSIISLLLVTALLVSNVAAFSAPQSSIRQSPLFGVSHPPMKTIQLYANQGFEKERQQRLPLLTRFLSRTAHQVSMQRISKLATKFRRALALVCVSAMLWFGSGASPAYAAPSSAGATIQRVLPSASLDQMVNRYVKDHMFDEDVYDPLESIYREAYQDSTVGRYPKVLKEITSSVIGKEKVAKEHNAVMSTMLDLSKGLQKMGLSEGTAVAVMAGSVVIGTPLFLTVFVSSYISFNKRRLVGGMKKRYGDDYTVDAAAKVADDDDDATDVEDGKRLFYVIRDNCLNVTVAMQS
jgi:hypothetical protein